MTEIIQENEEEYAHHQETILIVGLVCMDIILVCKEYPVEDSANRALDCFKRRGGNGSNSCTVLSHLGGKCELLAPLGGDEYAKFLKQDMKEHGIAFNHSSIYENCDTPFTNIIISLAKGTRTGMHFTRDFPENNFQDFDRVLLENYSWVHFEGRNIEETQKMMAKIDSWNKEQKHLRKLSYSVELEKCRESTKDFIPLADYVFVSKDFARYMGFSDMRSTIDGLTPLIKPRGTIIVPWGEQGAMARSSDGEIFHSNAFPPEKVLDSVGAGDTFIAATIFSLSNSKPLHTAIKFGCWIAGAKVGINGFVGLKDASSKFKE